MLLTSSGGSTRPTTAGSWVRTADSRRSLLDWSLTRSPPYLTVLVTADGVAAAPFLLALLRLVQHTDASTQVLLVMVDLTTAWACRGQAVKIEPRSSSCWTEAGLTVHSSSIASAMTTRRCTRTQADRSRRPCLIRRGERWMKPRALEHIAAGRR